MARFLCPMSSSRMAGERVEFADWLGAQRRERQWTTRTLSEHSGVDAGAISRLENNRIQATLPTAVLLADALQVDLPALYTALTGKDAPALLTAPVTDSSSSEDRPELLTFEHLEAFRTLALEYPDRVHELLATMLNQVSRSLGTSQQAEGFSGAEDTISVGPGGEGPPFQPNEIYRLLIPSRLYEAQLHYPPLSSDYHLDQYKSGGVVLPVDVGAYMRQLRRRERGTQEALLEHHRRSTSTLSRLEAGSTQGIKVSDMLQFDEALSKQGELLGMWWSATRALLFITGQHPQADDAWRKFANSTPYSARLMNLFVMICRWLRLTSKGDAAWFIELEQALQNGER